ncbi:MAG: tetratricopeptide repeat protein [Candidatus Poribacteria bacterium]|nr:tetratricopeptide repeat protein [Candidatus Poribacteria bacterium]
MKRKNRNGAGEPFSICRIVRLFGWMGSVLCCLIAGRADAEDYFDRITIASNGRLTRFERDLIMVYANTIPLAAERAKVYEGALARSLELWENATEGKLRFRFAPAAVAADIRITWIHQWQRQGKRDNIGESMLIRKGEGFHVEVEIALRDQRTRKPLEPETIQATLLHEIGHAIGLWGHSEDPNDVMYLAATANAPTARDVATWLKVRETPVNAPFHDQAVRTLKAEIQKAPEIARNHYLLGMVYADQGEYQSAIRTFQRALEIDPLLRMSAVQIAQIFQQNGKYDRAIKHYMQALRTKPSADVLGSLGTLSFLQGQFESAVNFFERALRLAPDSATLEQNLLAAYHRWGFQFLRANQFAEAIRCFNRGWGRFPFSEILLYDLAVSHQSAGEYPRAQNIYQRILQIDPEYAPAKIGLATTLNNWGAQHARNKDWEGAIAHYQQALEYDPGCEEARQNLEATLMRVGWEQSTTDDLERATLTYQELLTLAPENAQVHNNLGIVYLKRQEYENARASFEAALTLNADYAEAQANLDYLKRRTYDAIKRVLGPVLVVLLVSFLLMKVTAKQVEIRRAGTSR